MDFQSPATTPVKDQNLLEFVKHCKSKIGYTKTAKVRIFDDHEFAKKIKSMAAFIPSRDEIWVLRGNRVRADWYRSLAHELVHARQREQGTVELTNEDGHESENEANSLAGVILREYGRQDPSIYEVTIRQDKASRPVPTEGILEWVDYKEYNIHAVNQMVANGMLTIDYNDFNTYPTYLKRFKWMEIDLDDAKKLVRLEEYDKSIKSLTNLSKYLEAMVKALKIAVEDQEGLLPSTAKSDQQDPEQPDSPVLPSTDAPGAG